MLLYIVICLCSSLNLDKISHLKFLRTILIILFKLKHIHCNLKCLVIILFIFLHATSNGIFKKTMLHRPLTVLDKKTTLLK